MRPWAMWSANYRSDPMQRHRDLASFVVDARWSGAFPATAQHRGDSASMAHAAELLYVGLQEANLPYRFDAWSPADGQWVKDPSWFAEQSGTCLDFAVNYAAILLKSMIAPVIALTEGGASHAFVVVDLTRNLAERDQRSRWMLHGLFGEERVVRVSTDDERVRSLVGVTAHRGVAVDVVHAASTAPQRRDSEGTWRRPSFTAAVQAVEDRLDAATEVVLIDVCGLQVEDPGLLREPFDARQRPRPAVTTLVPDVDTSAYRAQREIEDALADDEAAGVVIHGVQGVGKSFASLVALKRQQGRAGWFLNATDRATLVTSLAYAEAHETQVRDTAITTGEEALWFAGLAVERLGSPQPWMVVLDNAEAGPAAIGDLLPHPLRDNRQRLVVTTTNDHWLSWAEGRPGWRHVSVAPLSADDVRAMAVPEEVVDVVNGRALFAAAFGTLAKHARILTDVPVADGVDPAAAILWASAHAVLDSASIRVAHAAAWMQPDRLDVAALAGAGGTSGTDASLRLLDLGVLSRYDAGTLRIHRLVATAVRATMSLDDALTVVGTVAYAEDAKSRADSETISRIRTLLADATGARDALWVGAAHSLATLLEYRGRAADAEEPCDRIIDRLSGHDRSDEDLEAATARALADALHGKARAVNQRASAGPAEALAAIEQYVDRSERLRTRIDDQRGISKSMTMRGLLRVKASRPTDANHIEQLLEARSILEEAAAYRRDSFGPGDEDTGRAEFNLGAPNINLAQADAPNAEEYLQRARDAYTRAWEIRSAIYPTASHPFRAASDNGWALADYYEALLVTVDAVRRTALLRTAASHAHNAVLTRQDLDGLVDRGDTTKSLTLLSKIADARAAVAAQAAAELEEERAAERDHRQPDAIRAAATGRANAARTVRSNQRRAADELRRWRAAEVAMPLGMPGGVSCVVTGRHGGVSKQRTDPEGRMLDFASLNLGDHVGDVPADVRANRDLVCDALGLHELTIAEQVHGTNVREITEELAGAGHRSHGEAQRLLAATDGMVTALRQVPLTILVADCVPVALYDPVRRAIGVAHAGRGGTVGGVVPEVIAVMRQRFGTDPASLHVTFGPHIGANDYEVAPEQVGEFLAEVDGDESLVRWTTAGRASLDLEGALRWQLHRARVPASQISSTGINTRTATNLYFSDRHSRFDLGYAQCGRFGLVCWLT